MEIEWWTASATGYVSDYALMESGAYALCEWKLYNGSVCRVPGHRTKCRTCGAIWYRCNDHDDSVCGKENVHYNISCGMNTGTNVCGRVIENYACNICGKTYQYKQAKNSGTCGICGGAHNIGASGSRPGGHNAVARYLVCAYK